MDNINKNSDPSLHKSYDSVTNGAQRDSWRVIFDHLFNDISNVFERESLLIRKEFNEKISDIKQAARSLVVGGAILFVGLFALVATAIIVLDLFIPLWAAASIVTVVLLVVGGVMVVAGKKKLEVDRLRPTQSIETLGEIKNSFKERYHEYRQHH